MENRLLEKYNKPVPRYTSYPPANYFNEEITSAEQIELIGKSNNWKPDHIALYVHIPFCKKICFYCGCNVCKLKTTSEVEMYMEALKKEILLTEKYLDDRRKVTQLHFGGGTPNAIPVEMLQEIIDLFRSKFTFSPDAEIAIETNPAYLDHEYLDALNNAGFNRFSFGIQDFDETVLKLVNREPSAMPVSALMEYVRKANPKAAINLDFIYGLPGQTVKSFSSTIEKAAGLQPDRLVTFSYAHVPWLKKHQQILEKRGLPGPEEKSAMFGAGYNILVSAGYQPIGLDHFVKKDDELSLALQNKQLHRNFQGYCTRETTGQVYAFGVTSISQFEKAYVQNTKSMEKYIHEINNNRLPVEKGLRVSDEQIIIRETITRLMCNKILDWNQLASFFEITPAELKKVLKHDPKELVELEKDGLIESTDNGLVITDAGSMYIRNIAATFDPAYKEQVNKYSKSV
ncbi:MAG: oxygen-independent coproporphyrinogen III oxidase [Bacteroidales bacterium]